MPQESAVTMPMTSRVSNYLYNSSNETLNELTVSNTYVSFLVILLAWMVVTWVVISSGLILICFSVNRNKRWPNFAKYILSLTICDFTTGIVYLIVLITVIHIGDIGFYMCSFIFYLFFLCQCACLYQVLGICLQRSLYIKVSYTRKMETTKRLPIIVSATSWVVSAVVCAIPFILWTDQQTVLRSCVIQELFDHLRMAMGYLSIVYLVPQILTNILYIIAFLRLRCIWRKIIPVQEAENRSTLATVSASISVYNGASGDNASRVTSTANMYQTSNTYSQARIRIQHKVLGTIGLLTLIFNVCTVPVIVAMMKENQNGELRRSTRILSCTMFVFNSALNPFVYALRTDWLKQALKKMLKNWLDFCCI